MPSDSASPAADRCRPLPSLTAAAIAASRGRRCVPPAPGTMPSFTSGRPSLPSAAAMRKWQPSAISSPPPSAAPLIAATTGFSPLDAVDHLRQRRLGHWRAELADVGPADEVSPAPVITTRQCHSDAAAWSIAANKPGAHIGRRRVDRRIVDRHDQHAVHAIARRRSRKISGSSFSFLRGDRAPQSGTTAVAWISTLARSSTSATTCMAAIAG